MKKLFRCSYCYISIAIMGNASFVAMAQQASHSSPQQSQTQTTVIADAGTLVLTIVDARTNQQIDSVLLNVHSQNLSRQDYRNDMPLELPSGIYQVALSRSSYQSTVLERVRILPNKTTNIEVKMLPATQTETETIQVFADQAQIDNLASAGARYLDRESLRSASGSAGDILRALDGLPGLFSSGDFASFTVRGNGPRDNLVFVDDFPFQNIVHFDDSFGELEDIEGGGRYSVFVPNIIQGATFEPGGWSAGYGGLGGSLLRLKVANGNSTESSITGLVDLAGFEIGYDGPMPTASDSTLLFSFRQQDFGRLFDTVGAGDIGSPSNTDLIIKTATQLNDNNQLEFLAIYAPEKFERDIDNVLASDEDDPGNYEDVELEKSEADNVLLGTTWTHYFASGDRFESRAYYRMFDESSTSGEAYPDLAPIDTPADQILQIPDFLRANRKETEIGVRGDYFQANSWGELRAGARVAQIDLEFDLRLTQDWIQYEYDANDAPENGDRFIVLTADLVDANYNESAVNIASYIEQSFEFDRLQLRAGLRAERDGFARQTTVSPRFGLNWSYSDKLSVSAALGRYTQAPRFSDRAADESNNRLENEHYDQLSVGMNYRLTDNIELLVEPYYQRLSNLVVSIDDLDGRLANTGEGTSYGFDTAIIRRFSNGWSANANYSYNKARVKDSPDMTLYDADFNRPHIFSVGGAWDINQRWSVSARWKFASGAPRDSSIIYEDVLSDGQPLRFSKQNFDNNELRFANFHSLNFRVDYNFTYGDVAFNLFLDVINAYGADNPSSTEFNERTGQDVIEEGQTFPFLGMRFIW